MAGEVIHQIRQKEDEGAEIISRAKAEAREMIQKAREEKGTRIEEKNRLLEKDSADIQERYREETERLLGDIAREEEESRKRIDGLCRKNLERVVSYITEEIVKE